MSFIKHDKTTGGKYLIEWEDESGQHEKACDTLEEANELANDEVMWKLKQYEPH